MEPKPRGRPTRRRRGRPTRFTWELARQICALIEAGATKTSSAVALGVPHPTMTGWENQRPNFERAVARAEDARNRVFWARTIPAKLILAKMSDGQKNG